MKETVLPVTKGPSAAFLNRSFEKYLEKTRFQEEKKAIVSTVAGGGRPGLVDGPALTANFKSPLDVAISPDGTIYVADGFNSCIRKVTNNEVTTFAGNGNANIKDGIGADARFKIPCRLTIDIEGNLYLSDAADPRIRKITPAAFVSTYAGTPVFGLRNGDSSLAQFGQSFGITTDSQKNIYIADSQNDCIRKISVDSRVTTIAGPDSNRTLQWDTSAAEFYFLKGLSSDDSGNLFVADLDRVFKITPKGVVSTFINNSVQAYPGKISKSMKFSQIEDMAMDEEENIYLTEAHRILKITPSGSLSIVAGGTPGYRDGDGESAKFNEPKGLGIDKHGNIYVADSNNNRIRKITFK